MLDFVFMDDVIVFVLKMVSYGNLILQLSEKCSIEGSQHSALGSQQKSETTIYYDARDEIYIYPADSLTDR
ncbi:hypothetical protein ACFL9T_20530 [Thermodesulfobacteriota bacterium]